jgi:APA family basic amino acid/polyamine antiporter
MKSIGIGLPDALIRGPELGGILNVPAIFIIWVVAGLLIARNPRKRDGQCHIEFLIKMAALVLFIAVALPVFNCAFQAVHAVRLPETARPAASRRDGRPAAGIFFAFYGFACDRYCG